MSTLRKRAGNAAAPTALASDTETDGSDAETAVESGPARPAKHSKGEGKLMKVVKRLFFGTLLIFITIGILASGHLSTLGLVLVIQVLMFSFAAILVWQGGKFTLMNREMSAFLLINMDYYYGAIPVAASLMAIYSLKSFVMRLCEFSSGKTPETYEREPDISGPAGQF